MPLALTARAAEVTRRGVAQRSTAQGAVDGVSTPLQSEAERQRFVRLKKWDLFRREQTASWARIFVPLCAIFVPWNFWRGFAINGEIRLTR